MKNIKLSISGQPNNLNIQQFVGNDENIFENYKFHINSSFENPDYWFVLESINNSSEECLIDPNHIIYLIITGNISLQLSANAGPSLMKIIHLSLPRPNNTNSTS